MIATPLVLALSLVFAVGPEPQALEDQARQLEAKLIAPCCWLQQVSVHSSPVVTEIKQHIRAMLGEGKTSQQVLDFYVAQYGDRVLAEPPARGFSASLYVLPWILLVASIGVVVVIIRRLRSPAPVAVPEAAAPGLNEREADRIDEELRNLD
jgi:cytochrome c-type biogenesis protein CcmH